MPWDIYEQALADAKVQGYANVGRYFIGLSVQSMLHPTRDQTRILWANQKPKRQDRIFRCLQDMMEDPERLLATIEASRN